MPPAVVATILAVGDLALMGLELPTGWFADRFGHRASLIVGSFLQVLGMTWCWLGEGVAGLVTASVLVALGDGFRSGADDAFLYRTCLVLNREADFQKIQARAEASQTVRSSCWFSSAARSFRSAALHWAGLPRQRFVSWAS